MIERYVVEHKTRQRAQFNKFGHSEPPRPGAEVQNYGVAVINSIPQSTHPMQAIKIMVKAIYFAIFIITILKNYLLSVNLNILEAYNVSSRYLSCKLKTLNFRLGE